MRCQGPSRCNYREPDRGGPPRARLGMCRQLEHGAASHHPQPAESRRNQRRASCWSAMRSCDSNRCFGVDTRPLRPSTCSHRCPQFRGRSANAPKPDFCSSLRGSRWHSANVRHDRRISEEHPRGLEGSQRGSHLRGFPTLALRPARCIARHPVRGRSVPPRGTRRFVTLWGVAANGGGSLCGVRCGRSRGPTWRPRRGFGRRAFA
jgi:hypothetical protein